LTRLVAQRVSLASHKRRDTRRSETPGHCAGLFMRDAKPEQLFAFTGTLLILNDFIGSGLAETRPPLNRKVGQAQLTLSSPRTVPSKKPITKKNNKNQKPC